MTSHEEPSGQIVETWKRGRRILWTYVPELLGPDARRAMPWLTVLRWEYDAADDEGMPTAEDSQHMQLLEAALQKSERHDFCHEAYRRIGDGVREFALYVADREKFLQEFNSYVREQRRYPITIKFYLDEEWTELRDLIDDFKEAS